MTINKIALVWIALIALVTALIYPMISEDTKSACHATEKLVIRQLVKHSGNKEKPGEQILASGLLTAFSTGHIAAAYMKDRYPAMPAAIGCWFMWWKVMFDPTEIEKIAQQFGKA